MFKYYVVFIMALTSQISFADCFSNRNTGIDIYRSDANYSVNNDGTITDNTTNLMWQRCSLGLSGADCLGGTTKMYSWQAALASANDSDFAGYTDWRLPNKNELDSLVEPACFDPAINETIFPNASSGPYWSSTPGWIVNFDNGTLMTSVLLNELHFVRFVRDLN